MAMPSSRMPAQVPCPINNSTHRITVLHYDNRCFMAQSVSRPHLTREFPRPICRTNRKRRSDESLRFRRLWAQCCLTWPVLFVSIRLPSSTQASISHPRFNFSTGSQPQSCQTSSLLVASGPRASTLLNFSNPPSSRSFEGFY